MTTKNDTLTEMGKLLQTLQRINDSSDDAKETVRRVMDDVIDVVLSEDGGGVLFTDAAGIGEMTVHLLGDATVAPQMLHAIPAIYEKLYGVPKGASVQ